MALLLNISIKGTPLQFIPEPGGEALKEPDIEFVSQLPMSNWCWAACSTMIINTLTATDSDAAKAKMCEIVSYKLERMLQKKTILR